MPRAYRLAGGELTVPVIGVALTDLDTDGLRRHVADCVRASGGVDPAVLEKMLGLVHLVSGDYADPDIFTRLADSFAAEAGPERSRSRSTTPSGRSATSCRTTCCRCSPTC